MGLVSRAAGQEMQGMQRGREPMPLSLQAVGRNWFCVKLAMPGKPVPRPTPLLHVPGLLPMHTWTPG